MEVINGKTGQSELQYNLAWVRTFLKNKGMLSKVGKGIWVLTENTPSDFIIEKKSKLKKIEEDEAEEELSEAEDWKKTAIEIITEKLSPSSFE